MVRPTAMVTGGNSGIGRACVEDLSSDHNVIICYNSNRSAAENVAKLAEDKDAESMIVQCDLSNYQSITAAFKRIWDKFEHVDLLVNNAAIYYRKDLLELSPDDIKTILAVNLTGSIFCTQEVFPSMVDRGEGRIVNISSRAGVRGSSRDAAYGASKGGLISFTKSLALQYTEEGVFSNVIAPGATDTNMIPQHHKEDQQKISPISRLIYPEEIADAVRFFGSTNSISGRVLEIDGGKL